MTTSYKESKSEENFNEKKKHDCTIIVLLKD